MIEYWQDGHRDGAVIRGHPFYIVDLNGGGLPDRTTVMSVMWQGLYIPCGLLTPRVWHAFLPDGGSSGTAPLMLWFRDRSKSAALPDLTCDFNRAPDASPLIYSYQAPYDGRTVPRPTFAIRAGEGFECLVSPGTSGFVRLSDVALAMWATQILTVTGERFPGYLVSHMPDTAPGGLAQVVLTLQDGRKVYGPPLDVTSSSGIPSAGGLGPAPAPPAEPLPPRPAPAPPPTPARRPFWRWRRG